MAVVITDFDADGDPDIVIARVANTQPGRPRPSLVTLYENVAPGVFLDRTASHMPTATATFESIVAADADGDGDQDLLAAASEGMRHYENRGGFFVDVSQTTLPGSAFSIYAWSVCAFDVDNDGDADMIAGGLSATAGNGLVAWRNDGTGRFVDSSAVVRLTNASAYALSFEDVDRDGDNDLAVGVGETPGTWGAGGQDLILTNWHRHISVNADLSVGGSAHIRFASRPYIHSGNDIGLVYVAGASGQYDFGSLGLLYLDPGSMLFLGGYGVMGADGRRDISFAIPSDPRLRGSLSIWQAVAVTPGARIAIRLTNAVSEVIQ
jgi:hypothetical protein